jgi:hypothetical protein
MDSPDAFRSRPQFRRGRAAEEVVAKRFRDHGWLTIETNAFGGNKGDERPALKGKDADFALPDLFLARSGQSCWLEVKLKSKPATDARTGKPVHGISARLIGEYRTVQAETGVPVVLAILEVDSHLLLAERLDDLLDRGRYCGANTLHQGGTWFFGRDAFGRQWDMSGIGEVSP